MRYFIQILLSFIGYKDTLVLMVSDRSQLQAENEAIRDGFIDYEPSQAWLGLYKSLKSTGYSLALAALPLFTPVPIQDVQIFDYAVAHKSVNSSYGLTASNDDTFIIAKDPYKSDQQRSRDQYEINDTDWNEVAFEEVNGSSTCKLALHNDWIKSRGYVTEGIVNMNLPEQGISGPFKITSIKHIIPQKKPVDEDPNDDYDYRPVTGLFTHESNDVWKIKFDDGTELGVTNNHPIYSVSKGDWQHAGHLEIGEEVLAKGGNTIVVSKERDQALQPVYNLEVKDLHNFLVGHVGVVVHNNYLQNLLEGVTGAKGLIGDAYEKWLYDLFPNARKVAPNGLFPTAREYDIFFELNGKKILGEAKSGNALNYDDWVRKYRSILTEQAKDAAKNGYEFYLFANKSVPDYVKSYCQSKGIPLIETLD